MHVGDLPLPPAPVPTFGPPIGLGLFFISLPFVEKRQEGLY